MIGERWWMGIWNVKWNTGLEMRQAVVILDTIEQTLIWRILFTSVIIVCSFSSPFLCIISSFAVPLHISPSLRLSVVLTYTQCAISFLQISSDPQCLYWLMGSYLCKIPCCHPLFTYLRLIMILRVSRLMMTALLRSPSLHRKIHLPCI
jgi:hypothetical protein